MKYFLAILMIILIANLTDAQNNNYSKLWTEVQNFEKKGLPKSALNIVNQISVLAKKENNKPQQIKTLLHKSKYAVILEENVQLKIINDFKAEISENKSPLKNVLQNMLATIYWQYFQQNRYKFYNRTKTNAKVNTTDFRTWDLQTLFNEIQLYYNKSLENQLVLQQENLEGFKTILEEQEGSKLFRPTLFDILSHNALDFFKTDENSITKPAYKFEIDNELLLAEAESFSTLKIESKDSSSLQLQALKIYQNLIAFHVKSKQAYALVNVDIERLKYVSNHATLNNKEKLLLNTYNASSENYKNHEVSALYDFETAQLWQQIGSSYKKTDNEEKRWKIKDAYKLCEAIIKKHPKSIGAEKCKMLQSQILQQELSLVGEETIAINKFNRVLVTYKNIDALSFKIYKASLSKIDAFNKLYKEKNKLSFLKKLNVSTQLQTVLKNEVDYQAHTSEIVIPKLENGHYIMVAQTTNGSNTTAVQILQVTNMAVVEKSFDNEMRYQIINRITGKPLVGIAATLKYKTNYNGKFSTQNLVSNSNGEINFTKTEKTLFKYKYCTKK